MQLLDRTERDQDRAQDRARDRAEARSSTRHHRRVRALGVAAAVLAALAVWALAVAVLDVDVRVAPGGEPQPVGAVAVAGSSLVAGLAGWGLLALLERVTARARPLWIGVAVAVAALSLLGPQAGVTTGATVVLVVLHVVVAAVLIPALATTSPPAASR